MTSVPGAPVNMKCHESLLYVAAGSSVTAVDLRTMQKVVTAAVHQPKLYSFDIVPSKYLICTGGNGRAMLWDIRTNQEPFEPEPIADNYFFRVVRRLTFYGTVTNPPVTNPRIRGIEIIGIGQKASILRR